MHYIIYRTTNLIDQKFYIGKHQTLNLNDSYLGSGIHLRRAIKKFGRKNFLKEILFIFDNEIDMNNKEIELLNENILKNKLCYNIGVGGEGGPHFKGKKHTIETIKKISESISKYGNKKFTEEGRKKIRESNKNRPITDEFRKKMSIIAKNRHKVPMTEETKNKIRTSLKNFYKNKNAVCEKSGISGVS